MIKKIFIFKKISNIFNFLNFSFFLMAILALICNIKYLSYYFHYPKAAFWDMYNMFSLSFIHLQDKTIYTNTIELPFTCPPLVFFIHQEILYIFKSFTPILYIKIIFLCIFLIIYKSLKICKVPKYYVLYFLSFYGLVAVRAFTSGNISLLVYASILTSLCSKHKRFLYLSCLMACLIKPSFFALFILPFFLYNKKETCLYAATGIFTYILTYFLDPNLFKQWLMILKTVSMQQSHLVFVAQYLPFLKSYQLTLLNVCIASPFLLFIHRLKSKTHIIWACLLFWNFINPRHHFYDALPVLFSLLFFLYAFKKQVFLKNIITYLFFITPCAIIVIKTSLFSELDQYNLFIIPDQYMLVLNSIYIVCAPILFMYLYKSVFKTSKRFQAFFEHAKNTVLRLKVPH